MIKNWKLGLPCRKIFFICSSDGSFLFLPPSYNIVLISFLDGIIKIRLGHRRQSRNLVKRIKDGDFLTTNTAKKL